MNPMAIFSFRHSIPWNIVLLTGFALSMMGCPGPQAPTRGPDTTSGQGSVYGDGRGKEDATRISDDNYAYTPSDYEDESIDSRRLNVLDPYDPSKGDPSLDWEPIYFDFDQAALTSRAREKLKRYASTLKQNPKLPVLLEGHCDTRGTENYNLALGERRAQAVKRYLEQLGVPPSQMRTISYGELKPLKPDQTEQAWAQNRRVSFTF